MRIMGTVVEPINPEAWEWYYWVVDNGRCLIVGTWWQTETGGILMTPCPVPWSSNPVPLRGHILA
jgi:acetyl-CoA synthetase